MNFSEISPFSYQICGILYEVIWIITKQSIADEKKNKEENYDRFISEEPSVKKLF